MNDRQRLIAELLDEHEVSTQLQLQRLLAGRGVDVTQATVSRDLDRLGVMRVRRHGRLVYALPEDDAARPTRSAQVVLALGLVRTMEASGNLRCSAPAPRTRIRSPSPSTTPPSPRSSAPSPATTPIALVAREPHTGHDLIQLIERLKKEHHT